MIFLKVEKGPFVLPNFETVNLKVKVILGLTLLN